MDSEQFRKAAHAAIDEIINYYDTVQERRVVSEVEPGYLRKILPDGPPQEGEKWEDIQEDIEAKIMPGLTHWQHPNFMAWFPASSTYPGMLGELYSSAFTAAAFNWLCSPAVTELETIVLDWLAKLINLPPSFLSSGKGGGVIQGSASEAVVTVMVAARDRYLRESVAHLEGTEKETAMAEKRGRLVALGSEMAHSSTHKAALIAGTKFKAIPAQLEDDFGLTGKNFKEAVDQCRLEGLEPFYLTASLGTTATCAVDNFGEIAEVLRENPAIWVHVDAAYAGAALVCEEYQHLTEHMDAFDSFDLNMHKWLLTNFDASCLFVKYRRHLIDALSVTPSYLRNEFSDSGLVTDYRDWQIPLGRRFRALKIWFVMRTYGVEGLKNHIRSTIMLGELFCSMIQSRPDLFKVITPSAFALTVFSVVPHPKSPVSTSVSQPNMAREAYSNSFVLDASSQSLKDSNFLTKQVYEAVNRRAEIFITSVIVNGIYLIRVVSANPKAEEKYVRRAFEILVETAEKARSQVGGGEREHMHEA